MIASHPIAISLTSDAIALTLTAVATPEAQARERFDAVRAANTDLNIAEFAAGETRLQSRPQVIFVELTENCNLSCVMCRSNQRFDRGKNMSWEIFESVADQIFSTASMVDLRGWGESTILKDFPRFLEATLAYGPRVRIVTNLTVKNELLWRQMARNDVFIAVSFDAATEDTFAALRPGSRLDVILDNLRIIVDERRRLGRDLDNIYLNTVIQRPAIRELAEIVRVAARLGIPRVQMSPVTVSSNDPQNLRFAVDELPPAMAEVVDTAEATGVDVRLTASLVESWADPALVDKRCIHPWSYCYVNYRGEVGFCDHLIGSRERHALLGDLRTQSFEEIWNCEAYRELRAEHVGYRTGVDERFSECNWCYRNRYLDFDELSYPPYEKYVVSGSRTPDTFSGLRRLPLLS